MDLILAVFIEKLGNNAAQTRRYIMINFVFNIDQLNPSMLGLGVLISDNAWWGMEGWLY